MLAPHGLTHVQFVLLASLWWLQDHERQQPTQTRLAAHAGVDPMMTSQVARKLEARGLLERHADHADSRVRELCLTPPGRALLGAALADVETADEIHFDALGDQLQTFIAALTRLDSRRP
ncbi:MAG: MarR family winged helix-turn-helix transcriptional regulator [Solirubrobacteraceae bacterium]